MKAVTNSSTLDLFWPAPETEGIKYAGSKRKLLPQILDLVKKTGAKTVLDGFAGSTRVSQALAKQGYRVIANDTAVWSDVFARCYLQSRDAVHYIKLIEHLNGLKPRDGWFSEHYGKAGKATVTDDIKMPWQLHNTRKLDAIREEIDYLSLETDERNVALASLMLALDKVDSTLGHYASYLREWSARSYQTMQLRVPKTIVSSEAHEVCQNDIFSLAKNTCADLAYYDPPYGSNNEKMPPSRVRYSAYYHVWTTVCLNDQPPVFGKANRRSDTRDTANPSVFEEFRKDEEGRFIAVTAIERLISETAAPYIVLSYSSGGRATSLDLNEAINRSGKVLQIVEVDYKQNVMAGMSWTNEWLRDATEPHREFLFLIEKS